MVSLSNSITLCGENSVIQALGIELPIYIFNNVSYKNRQT